MLGGVDSTGPHLFTIHAHGSTDKLPYVTMGSGSLAAMAVFESSFKENMTVSYVHHYAVDLCGLQADNCSAKKPSTSSLARSGLVCLTIWALVPTSMCR